jgi:hypothetical protein
MRKLFVLVFFSGIISFGQSKDEIYRLEAKRESPGVGSYIVNVLLLETNGNYEISYQEYLTKKRKKENLIFDLQKEYGKWRINSDTLYLIDSKSKKEIKFYIKNKNNIALIIENSHISPLTWKKLR